jgi:hypothetical protein
MTARKPFLLVIGLFFATITGLSASLAQNVTGSWTIQPAGEPGKVQLSFVHEHSTNSSGWSVEDLKGFSFSPNGRRDVQFVIDRDAGRIDAEGSASADTAAGSFRFTPAPGYSDKMRQMGLGDIKAESQISFALLDVSLTFAREMAALKIDGLTADQLLAMRIHGVNGSYVKDLRAAGARANNAEQLIAFRIHGVSPALVAAFGHSTIPDDEQLVALKIHGATPEWVAGLDKLGYLRGGSVRADQLVAFRIHGVTPDYIEAVEKLGYPYPDPDQLIAMRIHGVTPDYIASVKAKGVKDLSLEQLVAMRIHGID